MIRHNYPYMGKRFVLNTNENEVHDLLNEQAQCNINGIKHDHIRMHGSLTSAFLIKSHMVRSAMVATGV